MATALSLGIGIGLSPLEAAVPADLLIPSGDMDSGGDVLIPSGDMDSGGDKFIWVES